ncbi:MAG: hypothetical protein DRI28_06420, partial [Caldiserica bacterium]
YISFTGNIGIKEKKKIIDKAISFTFLITMGFVIIGRFIFLIIGIETFDFLIAGGLILIIISVLMLLDIAYKSPVEIESFGVVPLATPLLAGPGLLTTSIVLVNIYGYFLTSIALVFNLVIAWIVLNFSSRILSFLGREGIKAISKIASLLLASLGIMMIRKGIMWIK